jgi:hypothetical protein
VISVAVIVPGGDEVQLAIETSRLLYGVDREAYKVVLAACREASIAANQAQGAA